MASTALWKDYGGGEEMPLPGYSALLALYGTTFGGIAWGLRRQGHPLPWRVGVGDLLLSGLATHKLTRILTQDWVTAPLRAPFTTYKAARGGGEVAEKSRGGPLRRAVGDLLTCPYCSGPWVAGALMIGLLVGPRATRLIASVFGMVAVSDFLHRLYEASSARVDLLRQREQAE
jgi:hypothetical protein